MVLVVKLIKLLISLPIECLLYLYGIIRNWQILLFCYLGDILEMISSRHNGFHTNISILITIPYPYTCSLYKAATAKHDLTDLQAFQIVKATSKVFTRYVFLYLQGHVWVHT